MRIDRLVDFESNRKAQIINSKVEEICREQNVQYVFYNEINKVKNALEKTKFNSATKALAYL